MGTVHSHVDLYTLAHTHICTRAPWSLPNFLSSLLSTGNDGFIFHTCPLVGAITALKTKIVFKYLCHNNDPELYYCPECFLFSHLNSKSPPLTPLKMERQSVDLATSCDGFGLQEGFSSSSQHGCFLSSDDLDILVRYLISLCPMFHYGKQLFLFPVKFYYSVWRL